jgi:hypothetical protein
MEDAEEIVVETENDEMASESPKENAPEKSLEKTEVKQELDQNQSWVHVTGSQHDVGEPMDVDTINDLFRGGVRGTVEDFKTPNRTTSVIVIPDSSDSTGWPH